MMLSNGEHSITKEKHRITFKLAVDCQAVRPRILPEFLLSTALYLDCFFAYQLIEFISYKMAISHAKQNQNAMNTSQRIMLSTTTAKYLAARAIANVNKFENKKFLKNTLQNDIIVQCSKVDLLIVVINKKMLINVYCRFLLAVYFNQ